MVYWLGILQDIGVIRNEMTAVEEYLFSFCPKLAGCNSC